MSPDICGRCGAAHPGITCPARSCVITIDPAEALRHMPVSTLYRSNELACGLPSIIHSDAPRMVNQETLFRIPGRIFELGEITHKKVADMNRKERRAFQSKKKQCKSG